ncbi:unnamed protein product [Knipowitschia caucasica]
MAAELHAQIASIVEVLANAAVSEICKAVEDGYTAVNLEMSRSVRENECLRRRVRLLELQVSRYRAEQRLKATEAPGTGRLLPGGRALQAHGSSLQNRTRFLNRPQSKSQDQDQDQEDQDQDQEAVTTKTEAAERDEDSDIIIVKVESRASYQVDKNPPTSTAQTCDTQAQSSSQSELSAGTQAPPLSGSVCEKELRFSHTQNASSKDAILGFCDVLTAANQPQANQPQANQPQANTQSNSNPSNPHCENPKAFQRTFHKPLGIDTPKTKRFLCSKCPRRFEHELELFVHLKNHARQKEACGICGKAFACRSQLKVHQNVHTGERPFQCSVCHTPFSHPSNLLRHLKRKHQVHKTSTANAL